jgi:hypothetical protein
MTRDRANENRLKKAIAHLRRPRPPVTGDAGPPRPRTTTHLPPEQRLAAAIIFQAFHAAEKRRSSGCAAIPPPSGSASSISRPKTFTAL